MRKPKINKKGSPEVIIKSKLERLARRMAVASALAEQLRTLLMRRKRALNGLRIVFVIDPNHFDHPYHLGWILVMVFRAGETHPYTQFGIGLTPKRTMRRFIDIDNCNSPDDCLVYVMEPRIVDARWIRDSRKLIRPEMPRRPRGIGKKTFAFAGNGGSFLSLTSAVPYIVSMCRRKRWPVEFEEMYKQGELYDPLDEKYYSFMS